MQEEVMREAQMTGEILCIPFLTYVTSLSYPTYAGIDAIEGKDTRMEPFIFTFSPSILISKPKAESISRL